MAQTTPVTVSLPGGVTPSAIAAGLGTGYAIGSDGKLYAWGAGDSGQLGNGTMTAAQTTPVAVSLPSGVTPTAIASGSDTGYAIGSDGKLYAWGYGGDGELGDGTMTDIQTTPVPVLLPAGVVPTALGPLSLSTTGYVLVTADHLSLGQPADITVNATGPSGAVVTYPLPTVSDPDLATLPTPSCAPDSGSIFAIGTTTVQCSVSDVYGNMATTSFSVTVLGAAEQLAILKEYVTKTGPAPAKPLSAMLRAVTSLLATGQVQAACARLNLFIRQVERLAGRAIPSPLEKELIDSAKRIEAVIGC